MIDTPTVSKLLYIIYLFYSTYNLWKAHFIKTWASANTWWTGYSLQNGYNVQKEKGATASLLRKVTTVDLTELYGRNRGSRWAGNRTGKRLAVRRGGEGGGGQNEQCGKNWGTRSRSASQLVVILPLWGTLGNAARHFWLSQLSHFWHVVGSGQGCCQTSYNAKESPHCKKELSSPKCQ